MICILFLEHVPEDCKHLPGDGEPSADVEESVDENGREVDLLPPEDIREEAADEGAHHDAGHLYGRQRGHHPLLVTHQVPLRER